MPFCSDDNDKKRRESLIDIRYDDFFEFVFSESVVVLVADYPPFRPNNMLLSPHAQTIGAYLFRGKQSKYAAVKYAVPLSDGDRLVIHDDQPESWITGDRIAILFHGLCGCHLSPYVVRAADKLRRRGVRTIRVDMRGYGDSTLISKSHLHGGSYQDANSIVQWQQRLKDIQEPQQYSELGLLVYNDDQLTELAQKYGANYLVMPQAAYDLASEDPSGKSKFKCVYPADNSKATWVVLKLP